VNEAVAPSGEPAGVIVGSVSAEELFPTIDHAIVRAPLVLVRASVTVELAETAISGGADAELIVKFAEAVIRSL